MKKEFKKDQWFYFPYLLVLLICSIFVFLFSKTDLHIWINQHQPQFLDAFFRNITILGDGIILPVFIIITLFISFRYSLLIVSSFLISGFIVQILKHTIFSNINRPVKYMEHIYNLRLINGVHQYYFNSFPSGHSASAFVFFLCFAMIFKQNYFKIAMLFCALLVAFSRVYLSQHFLIDIVGGSLIGVLITFAANIWLTNIKKSWLNENILTISRK